MSVDENAEMKYFRRSTSSSESQLRFVFVMNLMIILPVYLVSHCTNCKWCQDILPLYFLSVNDCLRHGSLYLVVGVNEKVSWVI